jgi:ATP-dependent Lon protease
MYCIETSGYDTKEKLTIANNYLLPKIREQVNFKEGEIIFPEETLKFIISSDYLTKKESGVRNLKRCLEIIHTKLNLYRLMGKDTSIFNEDLKMDVTFPFTVTQEHVQLLIKNNEYVNPTILAMYC